MWNRSIASERRFVRYKYNASSESIIRYEHSVITALGCVHRPHVFVVALAALTALTALGAGRSQNSFRVLEIVDDIHVGRIWI